MSAGAQGTGVLTFAGLTAKFYSPDGFTIFDVDAGVADSTADDSATKEACPGDKPNWGTLSGTILILPTSMLEIDTLITAKTVASLSWSAPLESLTTNGTISGNAFIATCSLVAAENGTLTGPITFQWSTKPTIVNETA